MPLQLFLEYGNITLRTLRPLQYFSKPGLAARGKARYLLHSGPCEFSVCFGVQYCFELPSCPMPSEIPDHSRLGKEGANLLLEVNLIEG